MFFFFFLVNRPPIIHRKWFRTSARWQSTTLVKITASPDRDGRPQQLYTSPPPPQQSLQHTDTPTQSKLEPIPSPDKPRQFPLPSPRLSDGLQTPKQNPHRSTTELSPGPPLKIWRDSLEIWGILSSTQFSKNVRIKSSSVFSFSYKSFSRILKKSWFPKGRRGSTDNPTPFYAFTKIAIRRSEIPPFCCSADVHLMRWLSFIYIWKRQRVSWTAKERDEEKKKN